MASLDNARPRQLLSHLKNEPSPAKAAIATLITATTTVFALPGSRLPHSKVATAGKAALRTIVRNPVTRNQKNGNTRCVRYQSTSGSTYLALISATRATIAATSGAHDGGGAGSIRSGGFFGPRP